MSVTDVPVPRGPTAAEPVPASPPPDAAVSIATTPVAAVRPGVLRAPSEQRVLMAYFPTGVSVVTVLDAAGTPYGITCSSLTSVCLEPPTVLVSLTSHSLTLRHALSQGVFGITLLDDESRPVAQRFAMPAVDRFAGVGWRPSPLGVPWIDPGMTAAADCEVCDSVQAGDHTVLFGRVRNVTVAGGLPLLYGLRNYRGWPENEPGCREILSPAG